MNFYISKAECLRKLNDFENSRKEAGMKPGGGESRADSEGDKSSANVAKQPGDSREAGDTRC